MHKEKRTRRFFYALWPAAELRGSLIAARDRAADPKARAVRDDNLHMTLAFVGNVEPALSDALLEAGSSVRAASFEFDLDTLEKRKGMLWLRPKTDPVALDALYEAIWTEIENRCGLRRENRRFRPHVTLARRHPMPALAVDVEVLRWPVSRFALVESVSAGRGSIYRPIREFALTRA